MRRAFAKLLTAGRLAAQLDGARLRERWTFNLGHLRIRWHRHAPFVFRDLGFPFVCHPDWPDSLAHFCSERSTTPDEWELKLMCRWLEPGDTVIDAGANLGFYTFAAAPAVGVGGRVIAIDAAPYVVAKLAASARLLGLPHVTPKLGALTAENGTVIFYVRNKHSITTMQSLRPSAEEMSLSMPVEVPAHTLSDIAARMLDGRHPDLIKIDIEGAEDGALAAVPADWFGPDGPLWIVEVNPGALARFNATPDALIGRYPSGSFDRWLLPKCPAADRPHPLASDVIRPGFSDSLYYNFIAVPKGPRWHSRTDRIRDLFFINRRNSK